MTEQVKKVRKKKQEVVLVDIAVTIEQAQTFLTSLKGLYTQNPKPELSSAIISTENIIRLINTLK